MIHIIDININIYTNDNILVLIQKYVYQSAVSKSFLYIKN